MFLRTHLESESGAMGAVRPCAMGAQCVSDLCLIFRRIFLNSHNAGCCATWCPCIAYGKIKSRVSHLEMNNYPHPSGGDMCTSDWYESSTLTFIVKKLKS